MLGSTLKRCFPFLLLPILQTEAFDKFTSHRDGYMAMKRPAFVSRRSLNAKQQAINLNRGGEQQYGDYDPLNPFNNEYEDEYYLPEDTDDPFQPPALTLDDMALALRWTAEINRRLQVSSSAVNSITETITTSTVTDSVPRVQETLRGGSTNMQEYGTHTVPTYRIRSVPSEKTDMNDLTVFHAKEPRKVSHKNQNVMRGAAYWGPELSTYLNHLADVLAISNPSVNEDDEDDQQKHLELALAMIYLDRACSVETTRSNGVPPCPFCTPRTVHRLTLTAMIISVTAVRGITLEDLYYARHEAFAKLGISLPQLQQMVHWMTCALGDSGVFVTPEQMREWRTLWEVRFAGKTIDAEVRLNECEVPDVIPSQAHSEGF